MILYTGLLLLCCGIAFAGFRLFKANIPKKNEKITARSLVLANAGMVMLMLSGMVGLFSIYKLLSQFLP